MIMLSKNCRVCNILLSPENQHPSHIKNQNNICKMCAKIDRKTRYTANSIQENQTSQKYRNNLKTEIISNYGGKCECCGEDHIEFLTIDHINQNGAEDRERITGNKRQGGPVFYLWLKNN